MLGTPLEFLMKGLKIMRFLMLALVASSISAPAPLLAAGVNDSDDNKLVCRSNRDHNVGTRIRATRVCRTRAEWRQERDRTQEEMQQIRDGQAPTLPAAGAGTNGGPEA